MSRPFVIAIHPDRRKIELLLAANVRLGIIKDQFGISKTAASRYRQRMKTSDRRFFNALRRTAAEAGISRRTYRPATVTTTGSKSHV